MRGWNLQTASLRFRFSKHSLPGHLTAMQAITLYSRVEHIPLCQTIKLRRYMDNRGILKLSDLISSDKVWIAFEELDGYVRSTRQAGRAEFQQFLRCAQSTIQLSDQSLVRSTGWSWLWAGKNKGWKFRNRVWRQNLEKGSMDFQKLNRQWQLNETEESWKNRWKKL